MYIYYDLVNILCVTADWYVISLKIDMCINNSEGEELITHFRVVNPTRLHKCMLQLKLSTQQIACK